MKIYKITEASEYIGVSINTLKTLANIHIFGFLKSRVMKIYKDDLDSIL